MEELRTSTTKEKRDNTINKVLLLILTEYQGIELPMCFVKGLLEESIRELEKRCILKI